MVPIRVYKYLYDKLNRLKVFAYPARRTFNRREIMMNKKLLRSIIAIGFLVGLYALVRYFALDYYLSLAFFKEQNENLRAWVQKDYLWAAMVYMAVYAAIIACSIPSVGPLTIAGGFMFGIIPGTIYAVVGATIGATIAFLLYRSVLYGAMTRKYALRIEPFKKNVATYGASYLLMMHFMSVVPYFIINIVAAVAQVPMLTFLWTTVVGIIPLAFVYAFAGGELGCIESVSDIFSLPIIMALLLLVILSFAPILVKRLQSGRRP